MKWQEKHDIIIEWIDSCKTFDQLTNMIIVVKKQDFNPKAKVRLLNFISIKASQIQANIYYDTIKHVAGIFKV